MRKKQMKKPKKSITFLEKYCIPSENVLYSKEKVACRNEFFSCGKRHPVTDYTYIADNLARVQAEIASAAARASRAPARLLPVTKSASDEEVLFLLSLGVTGLAENRTSLFNQRRELSAANGYAPEMHLIGSLQKNKVKYIADSVALIQSLDSVSLAVEIDRQAKKHDRKIPVLLEVNSGREENKGGLLPEEAIPFADSLAQLPNIALYGVMTMGPNMDTEEAYRPYFQETRGIFEALLAKGAFQTEAPILSMGMSDSYRVAVEEGATLVRVGSALFRK